MAEILALGLTHYPPLCLPDEKMAGILSWTLNDPSSPAAAKDPANWPAPMREEWGADRGAQAAARHRAELVAGFDRVRVTLDAFAPDVVVIWGDDYPVITMPLNCYGRRVVSAKGFLTRMGERIEFDPPSPSPRRFMEMGAAAVRVLGAGPWRVALVASSSWSHAFLCDWTHRLRPDTEADRRLYEALLRHSRKWRPPAIRRC